MAIRVTVVRAWLLILAMNAVAYGVYIVALAVGVAVVWFFDLRFVLGLVVAGLIFVATESIWEGRGRGWTIRPQDEPDLVQLVEDVAARSGFDSALLLRLVPEPGASLGRERVEGVETLVLQLGWPYVMSLARDELSAVVAHELAHAADLSTRTGRMLVSSRNRLADSGLAVPVLAPALLRASRGNALATELSADDWAANVVGAECVVAALQHTARIDELFDTLVDHWCDVMLEADEFPTDLFVCAKGALEDPAVVAWIDGNLEREIEMDNSAETHPSREDRTRRLDVTPRQSARAVPVSAHRADEIGDWCLRAVVDLAESGLRPGTISGSPEGRFDPDPGQALADLREVGGSINTRAALEAVIDQIENNTWRELTHKLDPDLDLYSELGPDDVDLAERGTMVSCIGTALIVPLLTAGWRRGSPWLSQIVESPDGHRVDLYAAVERSLVSRDVTELRSLVRSAALGPA